MTEEQLRRQELPLGGTGQKTAIFHYKLGNTIWLLNLDRQIDRYVLFWEQ